MKILNNLALSVFFSFFVSSLAYSAFDGEKTDIQVLQESESLLESSLFKDDLLNIAKKKHKHHHHHYYHGHGKYKYGKKYKGKYYKRGKKHHKYEVHHHHYHSKPRVHTRTKTTTTVKHSPIVAPVLVPVPPKELVPPLLMPPRALTPPILMPK